MFGQKTFGVFPHCLQLLKPQHLYNSFWSYQCFCVFPTQKFCFSFIFSMKMVCSFRQLFTFNFLPFVILVYKVPLLLTSSVDQYWKLVKICLDVQENADLTGKPPTLLLPFESRIGISNAFVWALFWAVVQLQQCLDNFIHSLFVYFHLLRLYFCAIFTCWVNTIFSVSCWL